VLTFEGKRYELNSLPDEIKELVRGMQVADAQLRMHEDTLKVLAIGRQSMAMQLNDRLQNITPLHDRVIVLPAAAEEKTASGIIIPDTAKEKPQRGTVVAAGPGKKDEPMTVKAGDTVLYGKYAGTEISIEGNDYLIMRESDLLAIV
jgi:chaperonin GroES